MRNLLQLINVEFGREVLTMYRNLENNEKDEQLQEPLKILSEVLEQGCYSG